MATLFRLLVAPSSFTYTPFRVITPLPTLHGLDPMAHFTLGWITSPKPAQILFTAPVYNLNTTPAPRAKYVNTNA
jgi:hypothetical protein